MLVSSSSQWDRFGIDSNQPDLSMNLHRIRIKYLVYSTSQLDSICHGLGLYCKDEGLLHRLLM